MIGVDIKRGLILAQMSSQELLQKYCDSYNEETGFSCMLSVDPEVCVQQSKKVLERCSEWSRLMFDV